MTATYSTEVKYLVLGAECAFDDGVMTWDEVLSSADGKYGWSTVGGFRVIEVVVVSRGNAAPRFTFGRDVTDHAEAMMSRREGWNVALPTSEIVAASEGVAVAAE